MPLHAQLIPAESALVFSMNLPELIKKADRNELIETALYDWLGVAREGSSEELAESMDRFAEDPRSAGIDLAQPLYAYWLNRVDRDIACLTLALRDEDLFLAFIEPFSETNFAETAEGFSYLPVQEHIWVAWNANRCIFMATNEIPLSRHLPEVLTELMHLPVEYGLGNQADFQAFAEEQADMGLWLNSTPLAKDWLSILQAGSQGILQLSAAELEACFLNIWLNFEQDAVQVSSTYTLNPDFPEMYQNYLAGPLGKEVMAPLSGRDLLVAGGMSFNWEDIMRKIQMDPQAWQPIEELAQVLGLSAEEVLSVFGGEAAFVIGGLVEGAELIREHHPIISDTVVNRVQEDGRTVWDTLQHIRYEIVDTVERRIVPLVAFNFRIRESELFERVIAQIQETGKAELNRIEPEGYYQYLPESGQLMYIGLHQGQLLFANSEAYVRQHLSGEGPEEPLPEAVQDLLAGNAISFYGNLEFEHYPEGVLVERVSDILGLWNPFPGLFSSIEFSGLDQRVEMRLTLREGDENSLTQLLNWWDESQ